MDTIELALQDLIHPKLQQGSSILLLRKQPSLHLTLAKVAKCNIYFFRFNDNVFRKKQHPILRLKPNKTTIHITTSQSTHYPTLQTLQTLQVPISLQIPSISLVSEASIISRTSKNHLFTFQSHLKKTPHTILTLHNNINTQYRIIKKTSFRKRRMKFFIIQNQIFILFLP